MRRPSPHDAKSLSKANTSAHASPEVPLQEAGAEVPAQPSPWLSQPEHGQHRRVASEAWPQNERSTSVNSAADLHRWPEPRACGKDHSRPSNMSSPVIVKLTNRNFTGQPYGDREPIHGGNGLQLSRRFARSKLHGHHVDPNVKISFQGYGPVGDAIRNVRERAPPADKPGT
jgi:hypothetical protein